MSLVLKEARSEFKTEKNMTLGFPLRDGEVLLGLKRRGFGVGKWNGVGGKLENGETFDQCMIREAREEIGISIKKLEYAGNITIYLLNQPNVNKFNVGIYRIHQWNNKPRETEEIIPKWFNINALPFDKMWDDDKLWLEHVLRGSNISAELLIDERTSQLLEHNIDLKSQKR